MKHRKLTPRAKWLAGILSVFVVVWAGLWLVLADYQTQLPSNTGLLVVKAIQNADVDYLDDVSSNFPKMLTSPDSFKAYLASFGEDPDVFSYPITSEDPNQLVYAIAINSTKIATVTLTQSAQRSLFGNQKYTLNDVTFIARPTTVITAPSSVNLTINGLPASEVAQVSETAHPVFDAQRYPEVGVTTYTLSGFHYVAQLGVDGEVTPTIVWNTTKTAATVSVPGSTDLQASLEAYTVDVAQAFSIFISHRGVSKSTVLKYTYEGSPLYVNVIDYIKWYMFLFDEQTFTNVTFEPLVQYGPEAYSIRIAYELDFTTVEGYPKHYDVTYDVYVTRLDGQWVTVAILF